MASTPSPTMSFSSSESSPPPVSLDDPPTGVGLSDPHLSGGRRKMLDAVNNLHSTGVQVDIDIPVIAVIGSQSAGKSSLIERISGVTLPRASGTCTRCPTECRLSYSAAPWKCIVSIRFTVDASGAPLGQARSERFGTPIFDKADVEERVRRAQRAVLNPRTPAQQFLEGDDEDVEERQLTFSKNCVCLEISGADIADLSFVDLPGIIAHEGSSGKPGDVALVESLVETYITRPSCLILLTVSCETDFENQGAFRLARVHDESGKRTIGVLTKPDRIPDGEEDEWLRFIKNQREPTLANGWFAVKQPDSKAIRAGITWADARDLEDQFFSGQAPWSTLDPNYQRRLRTRNLTSCLSKILSDLITKRLPEIQQELQTNLQRTENELRALPRPPSSDPVGEVHQLLAAFARDVAAQVRGTVSPGLIQGVNERHRSFRSAIRRTAPDFRPYEAASEEQPEMPPPDFLGAEDPEAMQEKSDKPIFINEVCDLLENARTRELPGHYPFAVIQHLMKEIVKQWDEPAYAFSDDVHDMVTNSVTQLIETHFGKYSSGGLQQRVAIIVVEHIRTCAAISRDRIQWLLSLEDDPFTLNRHYYADYKEKFQKHFKSVFDATHHEGPGAEFHTFQPDTASEERQGAMNDILRGLTTFGLSMLPADLAKLLPPSHQEPALNVMAEVRAYYQVAYKRFVDNIPLAVDREILRNLDLGIGAALLKDLGLSGENGAQICRDLLQEPADTVALRDALQNKRDRLSNAKRQLMTLSVL